MNVELTLTQQRLRELAELRGLELSQDLCEKLLPLVRDLLGSARSLQQSDIWALEANPLAGFAKEP
jgi:hypothetical protein